MGQLTDITDSTGHVSFPDVLEGTYTIEITKQGYVPKNLTFALTTTTPLLTLEVMKEDASTGLNPTLIWLILIVVIVIIIIVVAAYLQKRRTAAKFKVPKKWTPPEPPKLRSKRIQLDSFPPLGIH